LKLPYFICVEIEEKVVWSFVPRLFTTAMIATEIPAAIRPYSMAVGPGLVTQELAERCTHGGSVGLSSKASVNWNPKNRLLVAQVIVKYR